MKNILEKLLNDKNVRDSASLNALAIETKAMEPWLH